MSQSRIQLNETIWGSTLLLLGSALTAIKTLTDLFIELESRIPPVVFWSIIGVIFLIGLRTIFKGLSRRSILQTSEVLELNNQNPDHLLGRENSVSKLIDLINSSNIVFLLGQSGIGKTAVVRAGLMYKLTKPSSKYPYIPIYFGTYDDDWETGLANMLFGSLRNLEHEFLGDESKSPLASQSSPNQLLNHLESVLTEIRSRTRKTPLFIFDQFDSYFLKFQNQFIIDGDLLTSDDLIAANRFWQQIACGCQKHLLKCLFVTSPEMERALLAVSFTSVRAHQLDPIPTGTIRAIIDKRVNVNAEQGEIKVIHPDRGWPALKERIISDLVENGQVLPCQITGVLAGLSWLPELTIKAYDQKDSLAGLEALPIRNAIKSISDRLNLPAGCVIEILETLAKERQLDASDAKQSDGVVSLDALTARFQSILIQSQLESIMDELSERRIVQEVVHSESKSKSWRLYHEYLQQAIETVTASRTKLIRELRQAERSQASGKSLIEKWQGLLSPFKLMRITIALISARAWHQLRAHWRILTLSLTRFAPALAMLGLYLFSVYSLDKERVQIASNALIEQLESQPLDQHILGDEKSRYLTMPKEVFTGIQKLSKAPLNVRLKYFKHCLIEPKSQSLVMRYPEAIINAIAGNQGIEATCQKMTEIIEDQLHTNQKNKAAATSLIVLPYLDLLKDESLIPLFKKCTVQAEIDAMNLVYVAESLAKYWSDLYETWNPQDHPSLLEDVLLKMPPPLQSFLFQELRSYVSFTSPGFNAFKDTIAATREKISDTPQNNSQDVQIASLNHPVLGPYLLIVDDILKEVYSAPNQLGNEAILNQKLRVIPSHLQGPFLIRVTSSILSDDGKDLSQPNLYAAQLNVLKWVTHVCPNEPEIVGTIVAMTMEAVSKINRTQYLSALAFNPISWDASFWDAIESAMKARSLDESIQEQTFLTLGRKNWRPLEEKLNKPRSDVQSGRILSIIPPDNGDESQDAEGIIQSLDKQSSKFLVEAAKELSHMGKPEMANRIAASVVKSFGSLGNQILVDNLYQLVLNTRSTEEFCSAAQSLLTRKDNLTLKQARAIPDLLVKHLISSNRLSEIEQLLDCMVLYHNQFEHFDYTPNQEAISFKIAAIEGMLPNIANRIQLSRKLQLLQLQDKVKIAYARLISDFSAGLPTWKTVMLNPDVAIEFTGTPQEFIKLAKEILATLGDDKLLDDQDIALTFLRSYPRQMDQQTRNALANYIVSTWIVASIKRIPDSIAIRSTSTGNAIQSTSNQTPPPLSDWLLKPDWLVLANRIGRIKWSDEQIEFILKCNSRPYSESGTNIRMAIIKTIANTFEIDVANLSKFKAALSKQILAKISKAKQDLIESTILPSPIMDRLLVYIYLIENADIEQNPHLYETARDALAIAAEKISSRSPASLFDQERVCRFLMACNTIDIVEGPNFQKVIAPATIGICRLIMNQQTRYGSTLRGAEINAKQLYKLLIAGTQAVSVNSIRSQIEAIVISHFRYPAGSSGRLMDSLDAQRYCELCCFMMDVLLDVPNSNDPRLELVDRFLNEFHLLSIYYPDFLNIFVTKLPEALFTKHPDILDAHLERSVGNLLTYSEDYSKLLAGSAYLTKFKSVPKQQTAPILRDLFKTPLTVSDVRKNLLRSASGFSESPLRSKKDYIKWYERSRQEN